MDREQKVTKLLYLASVFISTVLVIVMITGGNQEFGLIIARRPRLESRQVSFPGSLETLASDATSFLHVGTAVESAATSVINGATSALAGAISEATGVVASAISEATSAVASAIGSAESTVMQYLPDNLTMGTMFVCIGYKTHSDCIPLPYGGPDALSPSAVDINPLGLASGILGRIEPLYIFLAIGMAFSLASLLSGLLYNVNFWERSRIWIWCLLGSCAISLLFFILSGVYVISLGWIGSTLLGIVDISVERGQVYQLAIVNMFISSISFTLGFRAAIQCEFAIWKPDLATTDNS